MFHSIRIPLMAMAMTMTIAALIACGESEVDTITPPATSDSDSPALPPDLFSTVPVDSAAAIIAARRSAQPGQEITVRGVIGGHPEPFTAGRAIFVMADETLDFCGDECPVPWDACCVPPDQIVERVAVVQVVDEEGRPLRIGLRDQGGLAPNTQVTVQGTVAQSDGGTLVINADRIVVAGQGTL